MYEQRYTPISRCCNAPMREEYDGRETDVAIYACSKCDKQQRFTVMRPFDFQESEHSYHRDFSY